VLLDADGVVGGGVVGALAELPAAGVVAIDIPLVFPDEGGRRRCEVEGRRMLGDRRSTMFETFPRWVYAGRSYDDALRDECRRRLGRAPSAHSHALGRSILEAVAVAGPGWIETHPELAFRRITGTVVPPKTRPDGVRVRLAALGVAPPPIRAGTDDVLDACVCAIVARDHAAGTARFVGDPGDAIWY